MKKTNEILRWICKEMETFEERMATIIKEQRLLVPEVSVAYHQAEYAYAKLASLKRFILWEETKGEETVQVLVYLEGSKEKMRILDYELGHAILKFAWEVENFLQYPINTSTGFKEDGKWPDRWWWTGRYTFKNAGNFPEAFIKAITGEIAMSRLGAGFKFLSDSLISYEVRLLERSEDESQA